MGFEQEIKKRGEILKKIYTGCKVTLEEKEWLALHCIYNESLGYPYLNTDIISLLPENLYCIKIQIEEKKYPGRILPIVQVPLGKGSIKTGGTLANYKGNINTKPVKMLGCLIDTENTTIEFSYKSQFGALCVSYECEFYDEKQKLIIRKNSNTGDSRYAMIKKVVSDNKMLYFCKEPLGNAFDGLIFSVTIQGLQQPDQSGDGSVIEP